jgi:hypothetical protein
MRRQICTLAINAALIFAALLWAAPQIIAQKPTVPQTTPTVAQTPVAPATASRNTQAPKLAPPLGKMQGWTTEMRRQAALRNAERKTQADRAAAANSESQEVKK